MHFELLREQVHPGESWAEAADRLSPDGGPVLARDLSGDPLRFGTDHEHVLAVRPMTAGDLPEVTRWINEPHVAPWWGEHRTAEQVERRYVPALRGEEAVRLWVWEVNGRSVGFAQDYRSGDHPDYALLTTGPDTICFDYAVGEPAFAGRGLGTSLLWVFLRDIVWPAYPDAAELFAAPDHGNAASRRVLAKLGFTEGVWFDQPSRHGPPRTVVGCSLDVVQVIGHHEVTGE